MSLCRFKNLFGEPGTGAHAFRIFDLAIADVLTSVIAAAVISRVSGFRFITILLALFILGVIAHRMFCVRTTVDKFLFPSAGSLA